MTNHRTNPFGALFNDEAEFVIIKNSTIEAVFLFSLSKDVKVNLLDLSALIDSNKTNELGVSECTLGQAIFERLLVAEPKQLLMHSKTEPASGIDQNVVEIRSIIYLFNSYKRSCELHAQNKECQIESKAINELILTNVSTCMQQPELLPHQSLGSQWLEIFCRYEFDSCIQDFLRGSIQKMQKDLESLESFSVLKSIFYPMLTELCVDISKCSLGSNTQNIFNALKYLTSEKSCAVLGELLILYTTPRADAKGGEYMATLFGLLLSISIMPKKQSGPFEYFRNVVSPLQNTDPALWQLLSNHYQNFYQLIMQLMHLNSTVKQLTLEWLGNCLFANSSRGQLWNNMHIELNEMFNQNASDAFMNSLCAVLIRACGPLCAPTNKVLLVDPTYCAVEEIDRENKQVRMRKMNDETCFLPIRNGQQREIAQKYNFVTEIFFMAHKCFQLSFGSCIERLTHMSRDLHSAQNAYQDAQRANPTSELTESLFNMLQEQVQKYLTIQNCLSEPDHDTNVLKFFEASSIWLVEIALRTQEEYHACLATQSFAPQKILQRAINFDSISFVPGYLNSVPEYVLNNIIAYLHFLRNFSFSQNIEMHQSTHSGFFRMIILFMGTSDYLKNPHIRGKLAEALEFFLPTEISGSKRTSFFTRIFDEHPDRLKVAQCLLNIFVSIEMTGQAVEFEQKFNYRRPMYAIIKYLWTKEEQIGCFTRLANEAEKYIEAVQPPLFLRFINLLINDAIFLLDESFSNLQQIRQLQQTQTSRNWENLPQNERQQHLVNLHHLGALTRFDNILSRDTICVLELLTSEIRSIFCHNSMVDRIAAMLNYFLLHLVGPQREKLRVQNKQDFEFDPANTVMGICRIYVNLGSSEEFCRAVSQDGRSYSSDLFIYAENVLIRIGGGQLIGDLSEFAEKVKAIEIMYKEDQEILSDAPDEYLDPLMSTLMTDPVILPSSKVTIDRSTIARHLLSDQSDPFNREPLTMDKVIPNNSLREEIRKWIQERRTIAYQPKESSKSE